jgi:hypothetical protein
MTFDCVLLARPASWTFVYPRSCIVALRGKALVDSSFDLTLFVKRLLYEQCRTKGERIRG